eukprot:gene26481-biopygen16622
MSRGGCSRLDSSWNRSSMISKTCGLR